MPTITISRDAVNLVALDAELRTALGELAQGVSVEGQKVHLHLHEDVSTEEIALARRIARQHDAALLTPEQSRRQQRRTRLQSLRQSLQDALDESAYDSADPLLRQMAQRLAWLELEIRDWKDL